MLVQWSTEHVLPARRFAEWREACCQHVYALTPERDARLPFNGQLKHFRVGGLDVADIRCDSHLVRRRAQDISARPSDTYYIYLQRRGRSWFEQGGRRHVVERGDIVIADPNIAFDTGTDKAFDFRLWRVARARLDPLLARGANDLPMIRIARQESECQLLTGWLDALLRSGPGLSGASLELALGTLNALVAQRAGLAPEMREEGRLGRRRAQLQTVLRQLELSASDPELDAESMAARCALSTRALHQLFELSDSTFHEHLTQLRLAHAHALLRDRQLRHLGTAAIGLAAGFRDTSTFYRRFKARYGAAPGALRGR